MTQIPQTRPQLPESATGEERGSFLLHQTCRWLRVVRAGVKASREVVGDEAGKETPEKLGKNECRGGW